MMGGRNPLASVDMALSFLASAIVLFVFVTFVQSPVTEEEEPKRSLGQTERTVSVRAPAWTAVQARGHFALLSGDRLTVLDMSGVAAGMMDREMASPSPDAGLLVYDASGPPNAFDMDIRLVPARIPPAWTRAAVDLPHAGECPEGVAGLVTVFVPKDAGPLDSVLDLAARCGMTLRFEVGRPGATTETRMLAIGLGPGAYARERIFR
jgi:hypothetical protein